MIILAAGTTQIFPDHQLLFPAYEQGVGVQVTKTEAAGLYLQCLGQRR